MCIFETEYGARIRWPFCLPPYPSEINPPPLPDFSKIKGDLYNMTPELEKYIDDKSWSIYEHEQRDLDKTVAKVLKVSAVCFLAGSLVVLGIYLGRLRFKI